MTKKTNEQIAFHVSYVSIISNVFLSLFKLFAGVFGHSAAMISDAVHSFSDVFSTVIVMIGIKMAGRESDKKHPYGHERFECVAAVILAIILAITGFGIGYGGVRTLVTGNYKTIAVPGLVALIAAILSIVTKEAMYWYTRHAAKRIDSGALMADAWHHRSDALSSAGSFIGILGARLGFLALDSVACIVICLFIIKVAYDIFMDAIQKMLDTALTDEAVEEIKAVVMSQSGVICIDDLRTRRFGDKTYIDIEISVDGGASVSEGHDIAHCVHDAIEATFEKVKHCMVHVNPNVTVGMDNAAPTGINPITD